jgi:tRNA A58 N-methylase Trm61
MTLQREPARRDAATPRDPTELERLDHQGTMLRPATRTLFEATGIRKGMRVLDLGCGAGDVAIVVADLVGATGESSESIARRAP